MLLISQWRPPVEENRSTNAARSARSQPALDAVTFTMHVDAHVEELAGKAAVSWDGTVPDSWLPANRMAPDLTPSHGSGGQHGRR